MLSPLPGVGTLSQEEKIPLQKKGVSLIDLMRFWKQTGAE